jgi:hypothetical protein
MLVQKCSLAAKNKSLVRLHVECHLSIKSQIFRQLPCFTCVIFIKYDVDIRSSSFIRVYSVDVLCRKFSLIKTAFAGSKKIYLQSLSLFCL